MVSIIIVNYNTKDLLKKCLQSVLQNIKSVGFEIIVVDNASVDGSVQMVRKNFPDVSVIENKQNFGFAKANNIGVKEAKGSNILFLNSDIEIIEDNFKSAINFLESDEKIAAIGGKLIYRNGKEQRSFGNSYNLLNIGYMLFGGDSLEMFLQKADKKKYVDWVSGGFMLTKKNMFKKIKGFDENFFMYLEDVELCYRLKQQGYDVLFDPELKAIHVGQGSSSREFAILQIYKGLLYFYKKHKTKSEYLALRVLIFTKTIAALVFGATTRNSHLTTTYRKALAI